MFRSGVGDRWTGVGLTRHFTLSSALLHGISLDGISSQSGDLDILRNLLLWASQKSGNAKVSLNGLPACCWLLDIDPAGPGCCWWGGPFLNTAAGAGALLSWIMPGVRGGMTRTPNRSNYHGCASWEVGAAPACA